MKYSPMLLGLLILTGCANPFGHRGHYQYPKNVTKQCHLKVDDSEVTVIILEDRKAASYPSRIQDGRIVVNDKQGSVFTPKFMKLIDQRGKEYRKVICRRKIKTLQAVEQDSHEETEPSGTTPED